MRMSDEVQGRVAWSGGDSLWNEHIKFGVGRIERAFDDDFHVSGRIESWEFIDGHVEGDRGAGRRCERS